MLLLQALYPDLQIDNLSNSDDAEVMQKGLATTAGEVDIHHAGTAMRFLTAFFATQAGRDVVLTGSARMKERPIEVLVEALKDLGANIEYAGKPGCPPLIIKGQILVKDHTSLPANISSQYISALLLVAPGLKNGLTLELIGKITSIPYIKMTLGLLDQLGVENSFEENTIRIYPKKEVLSKRLVVESDWSSASYFYSIAALCAPGTRLSLSAYRQNSLQGDSALTALYEIFGVQTRFGDNEIHLEKVSEHQTDNFTCDLTETPDLAQTIAVTCFGLNIGCHLTGLHTLKIKESDRLEALKSELTKLGANIGVTDRSLTLEPGNTINKDVEIETYHDHRMAMAFAPLAMKTSLIIKDAGVVSKSYPDFWNDLESLKFEVRER